MRLYVTLWVCHQNMGQWQNQGMKLWMSQTEATLAKFYVCAKSYLFRMARLRKAFNACGFLMYCDETLVSLGHRISAINDYAQGLMTCQMSAPQLILVQIRGMVLLE